MTRLHEGADAASLGICRAVLYGTWFAMLIYRPLPRVAALPFHWLDWLGIFRVVPVPMREWLHSSIGYTSLYFTLLVLAVLLTLGVRPFQPFAVVFALLALAYDHTLKGFCGYTNHGQVIALYATWIMAAFPAADDFSIFGPKQRRVLATSSVYQTPMLVIALIFILLYMFIGVRRLAKGGLDIFMGDAMLASIVANTIRHSRYGFNFGDFVLTSPMGPAFVKMGYLVLTVFEILSPLVLFNRPFRYVWILAMVGLHVSSLFMMNIFFWENTILIAVFFTSFPCWFSEKYRRIIAPRKQVC